MKKLTRIAILIKSYGGIKAFRRVFNNIPEQTVKKWSSCVQQPPEWATDLIEEKLKGDLNARDTNSAIRRVPSSSRDEF